MMALLALLRSPITWYVAVALAVVGALWYYGSSRYNAGHLDGTTKERTAWETRVQREGDELRARIKTLEAAEQAREGAADTTEATARATTDDILKAVRGSSAIAIPKSIADRLYHDAAGNGLIRTAPP